MDDGVDDEPGEARRGQSSSKKTRRTRAFGWNSETSPTAKRTLEAAQDAYRQAIDLDPDNAMALNNLAWLYATETDSEYFDPQRGA